MDDKGVERQRYEERARLALVAAGQQQQRELGAAGIAAELRAPYTFYEHVISERVSPSHDVLELGAGTGFHTGALLRTGARVTASDISPSSLAVLESSLAGPSQGRLQTRVADIEALPFEPGSFDVVTCAGSLSYGDPKLVDAEILRVLRPGGAFICVDSLNHNPVYRLNRWINYRRGARTLSTLQQMPDTRRIDGLGRHFNSVNVRYFGSITWAMPLLVRVLGLSGASRLSDSFDDFIGVKRSAFKFVLTAEGKL
ncbi:MAG TPA: class I SAM-dependent methyltransferase [Gemmatimonadaceae bacterium]|nr:class I SAM-dependent methyltransferase [Gemmatimonadaceae bacterium]